MPAKSFCHRRKGLAVVIAIAIAAAAASGERAHARPQSPATMPVLLTMA